LEEKGLVADVQEWQRKLYYSISQEDKGEIRLSGMAVLAAAMQALLAYASSLALPSSWLSLGLRAIGLRPPEELSLSSFNDLFETRRYSLMRKQMESIEEFQIALSELVHRLLEPQVGHPLTGRKIVFFIDDLDRCLPTVALEIMETIKTFLDVPGCVYVLLCDQQLLGQGVKARFKELFGERSDAYERRGREYLDKIIQVSFQIPPSDYVQLKTYAERALSELYSEREIPYFDIVHATVGNNPRRVKRLCRGLEIAFDMMQLTLGRSVTTSFQLEQIESEPPRRPLPGGQPEPSMVSATKDLVERKREFAKVYCLQYGWPEALPLLRAYEARGDDVDSFSIPAAVKALAEKADEGLTAEERNLRETHEALSKMIVQGDLSIFSPLLVSVDWDKARIAGEGAIRRHTLDLCRFLEYPPHFKSMRWTDLKDCVEWSGVIPGEKPGPGLAEPAKLAAKVARSFPGVSEVFVAPDGREIRVHVKPEEIDDLAAIRLSRDITEKLEQSVEYPGQIKVMVIRQTLALDYAR